MNIADIRLLVNSGNPNPRVIAGECHLAIMNRPRTAGEHAELLCYYAEAAVHLSRDRARAGARYARQAAILAEEAGNPLLMVRAACLRLRLLGLKGVTEDILKSELRELERRVQDNWMPTLSEGQQVRITRLLALTSAAITTRDFLSS